MLRLIIELAVLTVFAIILLSLFEALRFGPLKYILMPMVLILCIYFMEKV